MAASALVQVPLNLASSLTVSRGGEEAAEAWVPGNSSYLPGFQWFAGLGNSTSPEPPCLAEVLLGLWEVALRQNLDLRDLAVVRFSSCWSLGRGYLRCSLPLHPAFLYPRLLSRG